MTATQESTEPGTPEVSGAEIVLEGVVKRYPGQQHAAVDDLSLHIAAGEIVMLVGPSGCGKTTSLKMINRLIEPRASAAPRWPHHPIMTFCLIVAHANKQKELGILNVQYSREMRSQVSKLDVDQATAHVLQEDVQSKHVLPCH